MIYGIGVDIIHQVRIEKVLQHYPLLFPKKILTPRELQKYPDKIERQINFLSKQLLKKLFPESYKTGVIPGLIVQGDIMMRTLGNVWSLECGLQWWYQTKEYFTSVRAPQEVKNILDYQAGRQPAAWQSTIFFGVTKQQTENDSFGLRGSFCPISKQIGKAFSLSFSYEWGF
ncbi:hypothetical protein EBS02_05015 [bacterium]|nr:hypothetical protein [bacterium]